MYTHIISIGITDSPYLMLTRFRLLYTQAAGRIINCQTLGCFNSYMKKILISSFPPPMILKNVTPTLNKDFLYFIVPDIFHPSLLVIFHKRQCCIQHIHLRHNTYTENLREFGCILFYINVTLKIQLYTIYIFQDKVFSSLCIFTFLSQ